MVARPALTRVRLRDAVDDFLRSCDRQRATGTLSATTVENYRRDLTEFVRLAGGDTITDNITGEDVDQVLAEFSVIPDRRYRDDRRPVKERCSAGTLQRFRQSTSRFFTYAQLHGYVDLSPMVYTETRPKNREGLRSERRSLTVPQADALLLYGPGDPAVQEKLRPHERNYVRDRYLLALMTVLGPRVHEVVKANRSDFLRQPDAWHWRIVGKGGVERTLPLSPDLVGLRQEYQASRPEPASSLSPAAAADGARAEFVTTRGGRLASRDVQRLLHRAYRNVLVADPDNARDLTPHALRHTSATLLLASGWDVKVVSRMLGHESIATTNRYLDDIDGELLHAVAQHPVTIRYTPTATAS